MINQISDRRECVDILTKNRITFVIEKAVIFFVGGWGRGGVFALRVCIRVLPWDEVEGGRGVRYCGNLG